MDQTTWMRNREFLSLPTVSLDPGNITNIEGYDESTAGYVASALEAFTTAHKSIASIIEARKVVMKNTAWTDEKKLLSLADNAEKRQEQATRAFDSANSTLDKGIRALEESLSKPLEQQAGLGSIPTEIRQHVFRLEQGKRHTFMNEALANRDTKTLTSILGAPPYLSGLSPEMQTHYTRALHELMQPEVTKRLAVMKKAAELVGDRGPLILSQVESALGGKGAWHVIKRVRQANKIAEDVLRIA